MAMPVEELGAEQLRCAFDPQTLHFETTDDLPPGDEQTVGQERALKAIDFGIHMKGDGFNIYISGMPGTGRNTTVLRAVQEVARTEPVPDDIVYLHNFASPDEPLGIAVKAGIGYRFAEDMREFVKEIEAEIQKAFISSDYEKHRQELINRFEKSKEEMESEIQSFAQARGWAIQQSLTGVVVVQMRDGHPLTEQEFEGLTDGDREAVRQTQQEIYDKIYENSRKVRERQRATKDELQKLDEDVATYAAGHLIDDLKRTYHEHAEIVQHLDAIKKDILENLEAFKKDETAQPMLMQPREPSKEAVLKRYEANVIVDNRNTHGAPVIIEHNPTYYNITGYAEYRAQFGVLYTDFTMIKGGSVHRANGGYLVLQAHQLLRDFFAWDSLKRVLQYKQVKIENVAERYGYTPASGLKPQAVPVSLKVIIVGDPMVYSMLLTHDQDFRKIFKVKADFDTILDRTADQMGRYYQFIADKCRGEGLLAVDRSGIAEIMMYSSRLAAHKEKLSARFLDALDVVREADYWARRSGAQLIDGRHIKKAVEEREFRSNLIEDRIRQLTKEHTLMIRTEGAEVGQINGISVIALGDYEFGTPARITAKAYIGKGDIVNIEREAEMSGRIHSKGVLILSGYLGHTYAQDKPLALSASITFEQSYEEVEGDSASSAELYCLLSSLAGVALRQDLAVTGSVDQHGMIQPVGGINQKIEGFFDVCRMRGLTGTQGVLIPASNVRHLMLRDEVVDAVREGLFHVYPVDTIDQGIEILTGLAAGHRSPGGEFAEESLHARVDSRLREYASIALDFERSPRAPAGKSPNFSYGGTTP